MAPRCAVVDWGTTSFRIWLLDAAGSVLDAARSSQGAQHLEREAFKPVLESHLDQFQVPQDLPVVMCGMVGSRNGWLEAPYERIPFPLARLTQRAIRVADAGRPVWILPGLAVDEAGRADIMRGEETQLYGAVSSNPGLQVACLPGTHSKWVRVEEGTVTAFRSYMTGDLYNAICAHTIMAQLEEKGSERDFLAGVEESLRSPADLTAALFEIRSRHLLGHSGTRGAKNAVSGLLIGNEIASARTCGYAIADLVLISSGELRSAYSTALEAAAIAFDTIDADKAVLSGLHAAASELLVEYQVGSAR